MKSIGAISQCDFRRSAMGREHEIRFIAYSLWEEEDCPEGKDCEHWFRAEAIWEQQQKQKTVSKSTGTDSKQTGKQNIKTLAAKKKSRKT
jgi:hypothetical protein